MIITDTTQAWRDALDDYGRALIDFENRLDADAEAQSSTHFTFVLPADLGPLPPTLLDVASRLVERSNALEDRVQQALDAVTARRAGIASERAAVNRARASWKAARPRARFVDVRG